MAKQLMSIRISEPVRKILEALCEKRQSTQTAIIEEAIRKMAKSEGVK